MRPSSDCRSRWFAASLAAMVALGWMSYARAGEPDPKSYWDVKDIRPGMKGVGRTVMVGTKLEEFQAEVLGVMKDVSPGRDMVLCKLSGCNLEHAGIIQGMSGSPIYIDGKLLGAVAFAWEFAKDPIAGVTPFSQMIQYVRSNDRRIAAESRDHAANGRYHAARMPVSPWIDGLSGAAPGLGTSSLPIPVSGGPMAGMVPIVTPLAASGFSPRALSLLNDRLRPIGMAPMSGGAAPERIVREEGERPLVPGAPLSIGLVLGDFDLSGIGTVTHVEGDRVYGFGHPMFSLGACELPMMTGYIHTVYPRASVSMKMGSPLKVVGTIDTDVSTSVAGRVGTKPDLLPMSVRVKTGQYADSHTYHVRIVPRADAAALADHVGPDQCRGHRGEPARGADGQVQRLDPPEGPGADHPLGYLQRTAIYRPHGCLRTLQPHRLDREYPGPQLDGAGSHR